MQKTSPVSQKVPTTRPLKVYAFDPIVGKQLENSMLDSSTLNVRWEAGLEEGPAGEYVEVVDYDPTLGCFYEPVNLNDDFILAQGGLAPSEGTPEFHQQMVYAVAMTTIANFEKALGRRALWAPRKYEKGMVERDRYVRRLRIYPHALREANAYYSPEKKALLFGYFPAGPKGAGNNLPGGLVFSCLSHDIIAHETTHALLDGLHPYFIEASNPDVLAFHEAFADIVALFQHFSQPEPLRHQIAKSKGDLMTSNLLGQLAQQFGQAIGKYGALRKYVGEDTEARLAKEEAEPGDISSIDEPHERGAELVAAVFDAFLVLYKSRIADLVRIASSGSGILREGEIHPDLVNRMADEASKLAKQICTMCIRALDYCPPFDISFGDYLRALITADQDLVPDDPHKYRVAIIEAFRRRGIYPNSVRTLSTESLCWSPVLDDQHIKTVGNWIRDLENWGQDFRSSVAWNLRADRYDIYRASQQDAASIHNFIFNRNFDPALARAMGLATGGKLPKYIRTDPKTGFPRTRIFSVRPSRRIGPDGQNEADLVMEIIQTREVPFDDSDPESPTFKFRGGCTLLINRDNHEVRWCIVKSIFDDERLERERDFRADVSGFALQATYFGNPREDGYREPFAFLHRGF
jgi:hypothetical protein